MRTNTEPHSVGQHYTRRETFKKIKAASVSLVSTSNVLGFELIALAFSTPTSLDEFHYWTGLLHGLPLLESFAGIHHESFVNTLQTSQYCIYWFSGVG